MIPSSVTSTPSAAGRRRARLVTIALAAALTVSGMLPSGVLAAEGDPGSFGQPAYLKHMQVATDMIPGPQGVGEGFYVAVEGPDVFQAGSPRVLIIVPWVFLLTGTELRVRLFADDRLVMEEARVVRQEQAKAFVYIYEPAGGLAAGQYTARLEYNGVPEETIRFDVVEGPVTGDATPTTGPGTATTTPANPALDQSPPYADPAQVLVVTRVTALREKLGADTDAVLAAAARVGTVVDLEADGQPRPTWQQTVEEVRRLLSAGTYRYLLILGNDDVVPFAVMPNPLAAEEQDALAGTGLPLDVVSDDPYTNLDGDQYDVPDVATARLPSSEDAQLLLTQLGDIPTPPARGTAVVNQARRSAFLYLFGIAGATMPFAYDFSPPRFPASIPPTAATDRFVYYLAHGIGTETSAWATDIDAYRPGDPTNVRAPVEWDTRVAAQLPMVDMTVQSTPGQIVETGACYGAFTVDTTMGPDQHKTADNSLALRFLKQGARAFVGGTHTTYTALVHPSDPYPRARSGFEVAYWRGLLAGQRPIDAFFAAKREYGASVVALVGYGFGDDAASNLKTLRMMHFYGRP